MAERHDWALFRSIEGLQQKAGVPADKLRRLVLKELTDNALDAATSCRSGFDKDRDVYFVEDLGRGLDGTPQEIASLFSIRRPMRSSKLLRLPQRGALGNGLRVVAVPCWPRMDRWPSSREISASSCAPRLTVRPLSSR